MLRLNHLIVLLGQGLTTVTNVMILQYVAQLAADISSYKLPDEQSAVDQGPQAGAVVLQDLTVTTIIIIEWIDRDL